MKRLRPILSTAATALPIATLVLLLALWVTSCYAFRTFSRNGRILVLAVRVDDNAARWLRAAPPAALDWGALRSADALRFAGFEFTPPTVASSYRVTYERAGRTITTFVSFRYWELAVPYWSLVSLAAAWLAARLVVVRRRRARSRAGACHGCGYDLTGNVSGTCPECGAAVKA
jgi:hypothetical protein